MKSVAEEREVDYCYSQIQEKTEERTITRSPVACMCGG
jgi:hypothetical protein